MLIRRNSILSASLAVISASCVLVKVSADSHDPSQVVRDTPFQEHPFWTGKTSDIHRRALDEDFFSRSESDLRRLHAENSINSHVWAGHKRYHADNLRHEGIHVGAMTDEFREDLLRAPKIGLAIKSSLLGWREAASKFDEHAHAVERIEKVMHHKGYLIPSVSHPPPEQALIPVSDFRLRRKESGSDEWKLEHQHRLHHSIGFPLEEVDEAAQRNREKPRFVHAWTVPVPVVGFKGPKREGESNWERDEKPP